MNAPSPEATAGQRKPRVLFATILVLIFVVSLGYVLIARPQLPVTVILIVLAGVAAAVFAAYYIPNQLSKRAKRGVSVGVAAVGVIATLLAPVINGGGDIGQTQQSPSPSPSLSDSEPLTANLDMTPGYGCEGWVIDNSLLKSVPEKVEDLDVQWVYEHGGASLAGIYTLTVQGKTDDLVIIDGLHIIDFKREPSPQDASVVLPCGPFGGEQDVRYFEVVLDEHPRLIPRSQDTKKKIETVIKFPYRISRSEAEYFQLDVIGPPCVCSWRLALEWKSGDRSGTKIIDRKFSSIKTDTSYQSVERPLYYWDEDTRKWDPPLPK